MKQVRLKQLFLRNFKGCRSFLFKPKGEDARVFGDNGTFKTTLFDGFCWLLFDKDSTGKAVFDIKTLDEGGTALHNLEHEVEGILEVSGKQVKLKKIYHEIYTQKRGSAAKEFTGHTTDYYVNDVPKSLKEYKEAVAEIADEEMFKLLTSPLYFNVLMKWQKRRETLLDVCGDISDDNVINSDSELKNLPVILQGRKIDDHKKIIKARQANINEEREKIPIQIAENDRNMPDLHDPDRIGNQYINTKQETDTISSLTSQIKEWSAKFNQIEAGGAIAEKQNQIKQLESQMLDARTKFRKSVNDEIERLETEKRDISGKLKGELEVLSINREITFHQEAIKKNIKTMDQLRADWKEEAERQFQHESFNDICPVSGQPLPGDCKNAIKDKAEVIFNTDKSKRLTAINEHGKELKVQNKISQDFITEGQDKLKIIEEKRCELQARLEMIDKALKPLQNSLDNYQGYADYQDLSAKKDAIEKEIINLQAGKQADTKPIRDKIIQLEQEKAKHEKNILLVQTAEASGKRIEDLKRQEESLAKEYEKLERELFLIEQFTRAKVNLLESQINQKFQYARFKLFADQINGGLTEVCETTYQGVPFSTGLNHGAQIMVGLDIIKTLANHYGLSLPIFIDNAEAVTSIIPINSQVIQLVVSEKDKTLRVEASEKVNESLLTTVSAN